MLPPRGSTSAAGVGVGVGCLLQVYQTEPEDERGFLRSLYPGQTCALWGSFWNTHVAWVLDQVLGKPVPCTTIPDPQAVAGLRNAMALCSNW